MNPRVNSSGATLLDRTYFPVNPDGLTVEFADFDQVFLRFWPIVKLY